MPFIKTLEKTAKELGKTVLDLFLNNHSLSVKDAMSKMGIEILLNFVDEVKRLVIGFLKIGKAVVSNFQQFISCKVEIPIFSTLYKEFISGGEELTFLDGFSMILAIPVTIIIKMTTGKAPADLVEILIARSLCFLKYRYVHELIYAVFGVCLVCLVRMHAHSAGISS